MPVADDVTLGEGARVIDPALVNLYGCTIGAETTVGPFVEIQRGVQIGARCKISSHSFICTGVTIEDGVFVGHGVMFTNDRYPRATTPDGELQRPGDWDLVETLVRRGASIGTHATILCGVTIGEGAMVAAGAGVPPAVAPYGSGAGGPPRGLGGGGEAKRGGGGGRG